MNENLTFDSDDMTEEQAKAEVERMMVEMRRLRTQIESDREEGRRIDARIDATMARVREGIARLQNAK